MNAINLIKMTRTILRTDNKAALVAARNRAIDALTNANLDDDAHDKFFRTIWDASDRSVYSRRHAAEARRAYDVSRALRNLP